MASVAPCLSGPSAHGGDDFHRDRRRPRRAEHDGQARGGDWLEDEMASLREAGADVLVCMLTASELCELELTEEAAVAEATGLRFIGLPTPDRGTPNCSLFGLWSQSSSASWLVAVTSSSTAGWE